MSLAQLLSKRKANPSALLTITMIDYGVIIFLLLIGTVICLLLPALIKRLKLVRIWSNSSFVNLIQKRMCWQKYERLNEEIGAPRAVTHLGLLQKASHIITRGDNRLSLVPDRQRSTSDVSCPAIICKSATSTSYLSMLDRTEMDQETFGCKGFNHVKREARTNSWSECSPGRTVSEALVPQGRPLLASSPGSSLSSSSSLDMNPVIVDATRLKLAVSCDSLFSITSMADLSSGETECGMLEVRLGYSSMNSMLSIHLLQLHDVRLVPTGKNVWFLLFLLPHQRPLFKTKPITCAAVTKVQEHFEQCVLEKDLRRLALLCQMYTHGLPGEETCHQLVGQARVRLRDLRITKSCTSWLTLSPASKNENGASNGKHVGDVLFSLSYSPAGQRLTVIVMNVRNVDIAESSISKGILTRVYLVYGPKVLRKQTSIQRLEEGCARFNESMIFSLSQTHLNVSVETSQSSFREGVILFDFGRDGALKRVYLRVSVREAHSSTEFTTIGHVTVGTRCNGKEFGHWQRMMDNPTVPLTMWHRLLAKSAQ